MNYLVLNIEENFNFAQVELWLHTREAHKITTPTKAIEIV